MNLNELLYQDESHEQPQIYPQHRAIVPLKDRYLLHCMYNGNYCVFGSGQRYVCDAHFRIICTTASSVKQSGHSLESQCCLSKDGYFGLLSNRLYHCADGEIEALHEVPEGAFLLYKHGSLFAVTGDGAIYAVRPLRQLAESRHGLQFVPIFGTQYLAQIKSSRANFCKIRVYDQAAEISRVRLPPCRDFSIGLQSHCLCRGYFGCGSILRDVCGGQMWAGYMNIEQLDVMRAVKATPRGFAFADSFTSMFPGFVQAYERSDADYASEVVERDDA